MFSALCLALTLLPPMTAQAAESPAVQEVKIGTAVLNETNKYYHNGGENGEQGTANATPDDANATFDPTTGTLTLNGLNINTSDAGILWQYDDSDPTIHHHDLTIKLSADSINTVTSSAVCAIEGRAGFPDDGPSLVIKGTGTLKVNGSKHGIWVWHDITIQDSAIVKVNCTGTGSTEDVVICNNDNDGKITIAGNAQVIATGGAYGIGCSDPYTNTPIISGGTVTLEGNTAAFKTTPNLSNYTNGCIVYVGNDAGSSAEWDGSASLSSYRYLKIESGQHTHSWDTSWSKDETNHWHNCLKPGCYVTGDSSKDSYGEHVYDNDTDTDCNDCGYIRIIQDTGNTGDSNNLESTTFGYAYDVQRNPAYPQGAGSIMGLSSLDKPLLGDGNRKTVNTGSWKLTKAGTYSYLKNYLENNNENTWNLETVVSDAARAYSLSEDQKNRIVLHELKDGDAHIAYGVVIAYDTVKERVVFIGDNWGGGAGYLLSKRELNASSLLGYDVTATMIVTDFISESGNNNGNQPSDNNNSGSTSDDNDDTSDDSPAAPDNTVTAKPAIVIHTVQRGDTLRAIARNYGCTVAEIMAANSNLIKNVNLIYPGWQLKIPQTGLNANQGSTQQAVLPNDGKTQVYIVQTGDNLWTISRKHGCTIAEIVALNSRLAANPNLIYAGWELKLPLR